MAFFFENLALPDNAFLILRNLIMERTGIYFEDEKKDMLADKLSERVIEKGFNTFLDYYYLLKYDVDARDEWSTLVDLITVKETYFWREPDHINAIINHILPRYYNEHKTGIFRIWCAACSTGEEPLSILIALDHSGWLKKVRVEIIASDISQMALAKARNNMYRNRSVSFVPEEILNKYFIEENDLWRIVPEIHKRIKWENLNLVDDQQRSSVSNVDIIFCRNVFIYMKEDHIKKVTDGFYSQLQTPGYLFIGVSESLYRIKNQFELTEMGKTFVYTKNYNKEN